MPSGLFQAHVKRARRALNLLPDGSDDVRAGLSEAGLLLGELWCELDGMAERMGARAKPGDLDDLHDISAQLFEVMQAIEALRLRLA